MRAGDEAAVEQVVRACGGRLLAVARRIVGSEEDARDVVQDAFMSAFRSLDRCEGHAKLSTWLHRARQALRTLLARHFGSAAS